MQGSGKRRERKALPGRGAASQRRAPSAVGRTLLPASRDWFWPLWLVGLLAASALTAAAHTGGRFPGDLAVARAVQAARSPARDALVGVVNGLGSTVGVIAALLVAGLAVAALAPTRARPGLTLALLAALQPLDGLLKRVANRPRPPEALVRISEHAGGLGFPSGHVFAATLLYGGVALLVRQTALRRTPRRLVQALCLTIVLLMGPARVYVGAHWPSDTLGGYLWGALVLAATLRLTGAWRAARR